MQSYGTIGAPKIEVPVVGKVVTIVVAPLAGAEAVTIVAGATDLKETEMVVVAPTARETAETVATWEDEKAVAATVSEQPLAASFLPVGHSSCK